MNNIFIHQHSLKESIIYFSNNEYNSPEQLGLFLFFKSIGLNEKEYILFPKVSEMDENSKYNYIKKLHQLSGIFDISEHGQKRTCLFPFALNNTIKNRDFFNPGSEFKNLLSRLTDTIDNTLIDKFIDKNQEGEIKFKRNYIDYIKQNFLKGNKIHLSYLSSWIVRFNEFENISVELKKEGFTRLCTNYVKDFLNISQFELTELFHDDSHTNLLKYSNYPLTGDVLRSYLNFENQPEVIQAKNEMNLSRTVLKKEEVNTYMELNDQNPSKLEIENLLKLQKQIILFGVPGIGKSRFISEIQSNYKITTKIQFHPSTSYESFIGGDSIENGSIVSKAGSLIQFCEMAKHDKSNLYLLVIDEINRGNISRIFGETITALDREYEVELLKPLIYQEKEIHSLSIPENVHIIATMNSTDRSIAVLDFAIRRRFSFVKLQPNYEIVGSLSDSTHIDLDVQQFYRELNNKILEVLNNEDLLLGQSYFLPKFMSLKSQKIEWTSKKLRYVFNYSILPTLEEYTYGNTNDLFQIIGETLANRILDDEEFIKEVIKIFPSCKKDGV